jgi:hypothetical protein
MGFIGGVLRATAGPPKFSTVSSVKNPAIAAANNATLGQFTGAAAGENAALGDYISQYMSQQPEARKATDQETGAISGFYNGAMSNQLAQLRAQRGQAMTAAANLASQQALGGLNRSRVASEGGSGSYNARLAQGALTPIRVQAALDDANQSRSDLGYVTQNQIGLAGQRNALNERQAAASSGLIPQQQRMAALGQQTGILSGIGNVDQQNTFYGLQQAPNMWADIADSADAGIMNAAAMYGSVAGGGMGKARGGLVRGPGTATSDSIPARLSKGEYVIPAEAVHMTGVLPLLERIRKIALKHREEQMLYGHLKDHSALHRGMHPVHGKVMDDIHGRMKKEHGENVEAAMARGGLVRGYADGGMINGGGDLSGMFDEYEFGSAGNKKPSGGGGGGGGGGLAGSAQQLNARAMQDLTPQWGGAVMNNAGSGGAPNAGGMQRPQPQASPMPQSGGGVPQGQFMQMSNWKDIPAQWQNYANQESERYNNPNSPHYIPPGTYE